ncbi:glycosyltransferase family 9 protein [Egicoccus sp. AB-alg2]|uniref:glycosyltransferase family 9 protein n=1 Tax=Egicoccus sp. AB-alg2 TaxID=3242693 RepID=UPI00359F07B6
MTTRDARPLLLVLRALGLGDLLTAVPALRGLRRGFPAHRLVLAAPAWLAPLVAAIEAVDDHLHVGELEPLPAELADRVAVAVDLHGSGPQSHALLTSLRPARLVAFAHPDVPASADGPAWDATEHEVARWCRLVRRAGCPADPADLAITPPPRSPTAMSAAGATVVHPGAKSGARRWPADRFAAVAAAEAATGRRVLLTGSPSERELATEVARRAGLGPEAVLAGALDLDGLAAVVAAADRVVCGDTGVAHLATAFGTPSVVLFGPTPPDAWGPPVDRRERHRVLWAGRTGDPLADEPFEGLLAIAPARVIAALGELPVNGGRHERHGG